MHSCGKRSRTPTARSATRSPSGAARAPMSTVTAHRAANGGAIVAEPRRRARRRYGGRVCAARGPRPPRASSRASASRTRRAESRSRVVLHGARTVLRRVVDRPRSDAVEEATAREAAGRDDGDQAQRRASLSSVPVARACVGCKATAAGELQRSEGRPGSASTTAPYVP